MIVRSRLRISRAWLLSLALTFAFSPVLHAQVNASAIKLGLEQSIEIGVRNATLVLRGQNDFALSGTEVLQGYAQFLPNLNVGASHYYASGSTLLTFSGANPLDSSSRNVSLDLSSTLNLFNGLADIASLKSALARRSSRLSSLIWAKQQVALDIAQSYLQLVLDQLLVEIAQRNLAASRARLRLLQAQARVGSATLADLYRQEAQTSADELTTMSFETRLHDDQVLLIRKLRIDPGKSYVFERPGLEADPTSVATRPLEELLERARRDRSDVQALKHREEYTDWDVTRARSGFLPKLDLSFDRASAGHYLISQRLNGIDVLPASQLELYSQLGNYTIYTVTLGLTWNIFDRFTTKLDVDRASTIRDNARVDYDDSRLQVEADVRIAYNDHQIARNQLATARVGVRAAQRAFDSIVGRYQVGAATFIDVLASQSALVQAQSSEAQAQVNLKLREKVLEYAVGVLGG